MRMVGVLAMLGLSGVAQAQNVANGSFENGMTNWTETSSTFCSRSPIQWCLDGWADAIAQPDLGFNPPDGSAALVVYTGDEENGWQSSYGGAESDAFLVTRPVMGFSYGTDSPDIEVWLSFYDAAGTDLGDFQLPATGGYMVSEQADISGACGYRISAEVTAWPTDGGWQGANEGLAFFDSFGLHTTACPQFLDVDGDGYCPNGIDSNNNGDCASANEPRQDVQDCDEGNPGVNVGATEIPGNGVDENCDGYDGNSGTTGTGSGTGSGTGTGSGSGTGGGTGSGTGGTGSGSGGGTGSGTGAGTGTGTGAGTGSGTGGIGPTGTDPEKDSEEAILASGAGCGCSSGAAPVSGWLAIGLVALALRRRD